MTSADLHPELHLGTRQASRASVGLCPLVADPTRHPGYGVLRTRALADIVPFKHSKIHRRWHPRVRPIEQWLAEWASTI